MIGLVDFPDTFRQPDTGCTHLTAIPEPPGAPWSGLLIYCASPEAFERASHAINGLRAVRRHLPIGLAWPEDFAPYGGIALAALGLELGVKVRSDRPIPDAGLRWLRQRAAAQAVLEDVLEFVRPQSPETRSLVERLVMGKLAGHGLRRISKNLECVPSTLYRRLRSDGLPSPGKIGTLAKVLAVQELVRRGDPLGKASRWAGWSDSSSYYRATRTVADTLPDCNAAQ